MTLTPTQLREIAKEIMERSPNLSRVIHPKGWGEDILIFVDRKTCLLSNSYDNLIVDAIEVNGTTYCPDAETREILTKARMKFRKSLG
jgi:hypothetical protein